MADRTQAPGKLAAKLCSARVRGRALRLLLLGPSLGACMAVGGQDAGASVAAPFSGTWVHYDSAYDCLHSLILGVKDGAAAYEFDLTCTLNAGGHGVQVETGGYAVADGGVASFTPTQTTCIGVGDHMDNISLLNTGELQVIGPSGNLIYEPVSVSQVPADSTLGCFGSDGSFVARDLTAR
jgi:hypothetical protein